MLHQLLWLSLLPLVWTTGYDWQFTNDRYSGSIKECSVSCQKQYVFTKKKMGIHLPQVDRVESVKFRINKTSLHQFKAETLIVGDFAFLFIRTKTDGTSNLNREGRSFYSLSVRANIIFNDGRMVTDTAVIDISILDINDAPPLFTKGLYEFDVAQSADIFSTVGRVHATDADEGMNEEIYYSFENMLPEFAIHPTQGSIYLTRNLSSTGVRKYTTTVIAANRGLGRQTSAHVTFNIVQENDHSPQFIVSERPPLSAYTPAGVTIVVVQVYDIDSGANGLLRNVEIISAVGSDKPDARDYFRLSPSKRNVGQLRAEEYQLQVVKSMEDIGNHVNITLQAWDRGSPGKSSQKMILVELITPSRYTDGADVVHINVNEGSPVGTPLHYVAPPRDAVDATYRMARDDFGTFRVHSTSGVVFLNRPVDAEEDDQTQIEIGVRAKLNALERFEYIVKLSISIIDCNDNAPVFVNVLEKPLREDSAIGELVTIASARDADSGENGLITYSIPSYSSVPFKIDAFSGEIRLTADVDYDRGVRVYHIPVRASDRGTPFRRQTEKTFTINIGNVNDNKPMFVSDSCTVRISPDLPSNSPVTKVLALDVDGDVGEITYSITAEDERKSFLRVDADSGSIFTSRSLAGVGATPVKFWVAASDGFNSADPMELSVQVESYVPDQVQVVCHGSQARNLYDDALRTAASMNPVSESIVLPPSTFTVNRHRPVFDSKLTGKSTEYSLPEDLAVGSIITHIVATDEDPGYAGLLRYHILNGNSLGHFAINDSTGTLVVFAPLDRETIPTYNLTVLVTDGAETNVKSASINIFMTVIDANDNAPQFLSPTFETYINETAANGTEVLQVMARDADTGPNGQIVYSLITDTPYFIINGASGRLTVNKPLDRESKDRHVLEVKASDSPDGAGEVKFSTATVIIYISDVNDNPPVFMKPVFVVRVREDMPVGAVITNMVAHDADLPATGGEVTYRFSKGGGDVFSIDKNTGIVKLMKALDFEAQELYVMTVRARDNGTASRRTTCELKVEVIDVNENLNKPVFEELAYEGAISENVLLGTKVMQVKATDSDEALKDHKLAYSIREGSGLGTFTIDNLGNIRTSTMLDRETKSSYWIKVYAQDHGAVPLFSFVHVYIEVTDVNDNVPEAAQPVFYFSVPENGRSSFPIGSVVASDRDATADISYRITGGNTQGLFNIDRNTGLISTTRRTPDRESGEHHVLQVTISDGAGAASLSSSVQVWITVTDENDNPPSFGSMGHMASILRCGGRSEPVYRVVASDVDKGANGSITYSLPEDEDRRLWRVEPTTGELYLIADWPTSDEATVKVTATDEGLSPLSSFIHITFELIDCVPSSLPPIITPMQRALVSETAQPHDEIRMVFAIDPDSVSLRYSIVDGADWLGFPMFSIQADNGLVQVAGHLDCESKSEYQLNISVSDGYNTRYTPLQIAVSNFNEFQPKFEKRIYEVTVMENIRIGSDVINLTATDEDFDTPVYLIYSSINNSTYDLFDIDHSTGVISTLQALDHETCDRHELIVRVHDNGPPEYSDFAKVIIHVEDHNDHIPTFLSEEMSVTVHELAVVGTQITQVQAVDKDSGDNAKIQYSLQSGNVGYAFSMDAELGFLTLARSLDMEVKKDYELVIVANDLGVPSLSSSCLVKVRVTVPEGSLPSFESDLFSAELPENEPVGSFVLALSGESQSTLTFNIVHDDDNANFVVNPNSGILTSNKVFDYEEKSMYSISLMATDIVGNQVPLTVIVHIKDKNDNRPVFNPRRYEGHISEGATAGSIVLANGSVPLMVSAHDRDANLNALLLYSIVESEARRYFVIDANTGAIRASTIPDRELKSRFEFTVQVRDQALDSLYEESPELAVHSGEESLSAADPARVVIIIDDINDSPPIFPVANQQVTLLTPTYPGVIVHTLAASDSDLQSKLEYDIVSGNVDGKFSIHRESGAVYVEDAKSLRPEYNLGVKVTDGVHDNTYILTVKTLSARDSLSFPHSIYTAEVEENKTDSQTLLIVQPLHLELGEPVTFELLNYRESFKIGRTSGVLETVGGRALDREKQQRYQVIVRVQTLGRGPPKLAQVPVIVTVADVNDNAPYFMRDHYYATATVSTRRGTVIARLLARDADAGDNKQIRYSLSSDSHNDFKISKRSGEVSVKRLLTDSANREYPLTIIAQDLGDPPLSSQTLLTVKVYTASTPNFTQVVYESSIPENIPIASAVTTVSATSPDNHKIIYSIVDGDPNTEFLVHFSTAMDYNGPCTVRVNDVMDFELRASYELKIRAVDVKTGDWADATVIIKIQDVNDQKPSFDFPEYHKTISEAVTIGSEVISARASDEDSGINSLIHYQLQAFDGRPDHLLFRVENSDGLAKIYTTAALDRERNSTLEFSLVATDGGSPRLFTQVYVCVKLLDLNDNAPVFERNEYKVTISDEVKKGQFIGMVSARDKDESGNNDLLYNIVQGNHGQTFTIDKVTGSVYISQFHQPSNYMDVYALNVSVTDGVFTCFTLMTVKVIAANRHNPNFDIQVYHLRAEEEINEEQLIGQVEATDKDEGWFGVVTYSLIGHRLHDLFYVQPETGEITVTRKLDREERDFYMLPIMARDPGGRTHVTSVNVKVVDVNDHGPQFTASSYSAAMSNNATIGTELVTVSAFDLDIDENARLVYSISDVADIHGMFSIDSSSGRIELRRQLLREEYDREMSFFVKVTDSGAVPREATVLVTATLTSLPIPVFTSDDIHIFLQETAKIGSQVFKVLAHYPGDSRPGYRIKSGGCERTNQPPVFVVDDYGNITIFAPLDREVQSRYDLSVQVFTHSVPELVDTLSVVFSIINPKDQPLFTSETYTVTVSEGLPVSSTILQVSAFGTDQDHDTGIVYSFPPAYESYKNLFALDENHGSLSLLVPLDREERSSYEFYVQASYKNSKESPVSEAKVVINLLDVNDCPPTFPDTVMLGGVEYWNGSTAAVNEDAPMGTIVVTIQAVDDDLPENSTITYYISGGNGQGRFQLKQTGEIYVSKLLDRESLVEHHLEITATDGLFVSTVMVVVNILDANDNWPVCAQNLYTEVLLEDIDVGTRVLTIQGSDQDERGSDNSRLTFSLEGEGADDFAIDTDAEKGHIRVFKALDREKLASYQLTGVIRDGPGLECRADIVFKLTDVNDNSPVFDQSHYTFALPENSTNNTLLLRLTANDKDSGHNRKVNYSLLSGSSDLFAIEASSGIVRLIKPLQGRADVKRGDSYTLVLAATDGGNPPRTGTTQLEVHISDVNDPPSFEKALYNKSISESVHPSTKLLKVKARSRDTGANSVITYRISNGGANNELFSIDPQTGELSTNGYFDYELVREYVLNIEARDGGDPPLSDMCMVAVYVTDANDNEPTFAQLKYTASVMEDAGDGDFVTKVEAQDADSGANSQITYSIKSGNDLGQFSINPDSGDVMVAAALDREAIAAYHLTVEANDNGVERLTSTAQLTIMIGDVNDNPPTFSRHNYTVQVKVYADGSLYRNTTNLVSPSSSPPLIGRVGEDSTPADAGEAADRHQPVRLSVTDADADPNAGPFRYTILSGDNDHQFSIGSDGLLTAHGTFDLNGKTDYRLKVLVTDNGVPSLSTIAFINVYVREATLHPPEVASPLNLTVVAYEDTFPGGVIGYVSATDDDFDELTYHLATPHYHRLFSMDSKTGALSSYSLDASTYRLEVNVSDGRHYRMAVVQVTVMSMTDEMMEKAVGVAIANTSAQAFLMHHFNPFNMALKSMAQDIRKVHILSINEGWERRGHWRQKRETFTGSLLVLVAVESSAQIISKSRLTSLLKDSTERIGHILGGREVGLPASDYVCSDKLSCNADEACQLRYQVTQDKVIIDTKQQSFVSLLAQPVERCVCLRETCINPCSTNPCPSNKFCVAGGHSNAFSCRCAPGTFGSDCDLHNGSPLAFNGDSYARWPLVNDIKTEMHLTLTFRTKQSDAVLMDARGGTDYSTLEIVGGLVRYTFECGSGPASAYIDVKVNDGSWHNVSVDRNGNFARLEVDKKYMKEVQGDRGTRQINLIDNNVYFGAIVRDAASGSSGRLQAGFKGCMKNIKIKQVPLPLTGSNSVGYDAQFEGVSFTCHQDYYGPCSVDPCLNGGTCRHIGGRAECSCTGYTGRRCEIDINECTDKNPCASGSTCENTEGSFKCHCPTGKAGTTCNQVDECLNNPCGENGQCVNLDIDLGLGTYMCQCANGKTGNDCSVEVEHLVNGSLSMRHIIYIAVGGAALLIIIIVVVVVVRCSMARRRRRQAKCPKKVTSERDLSFPVDVEPAESTAFIGHHRAASPSPPSVPPRPASYTPSVNGNIMLNRNHEMSMDYGSAGDGLDRVGKGRMFTNAPGRVMTTFSKLSPPPPSLSDTGSITKPSWDFNRSYDNQQSGRAPSATDEKAASAQASRSGSKFGSKSASITNGSFGSIGQEDEGYHWDTSDWAPLNEHGDRPMGRNVYPPAARLLSMSEVDDSEYVGDSEIDDDVIPEISGASCVDGIQALQAQYKLEYDVPEIVVPKFNHNHYLPRHGEMQHAESPLSQLLPPGGAIPAVPQRSASLSYSADDIVKGNEGDPMAGYISTEADDNQSDLSENICDIESEGDEDVQGILSSLAGTQRPHNSEV